MAQYAARGTQYAVPLGATAVDPTQVVVWNTPGPTANANIQPGSGAALTLLNDVGNAGVSLEAGANRAVVIGNPQGSDISASDVRIGQGGNGLEVASAGWLFRVSGSTRVQGTSSEVQLRNATSITVYNGNATDARWTRTISSDRGDSATPADGAAANSPTYGLRIYNDPAGAGALESFDYTIQYTTSAGAGSADVDTVVNHAVRGVIALGLFHDEGINACAVLLPSVDTSVVGVAGFPDGVIIYDSTEAAGSRFRGKHAGAWVNLG